MSTKHRIISVGNLNMDLIGKIEELPKPDEKALLDSFTRRPGGGAANFAVACSKLGLEAGFIGCVGNDSFGKEILEDLKKRGVDTSLVRKVDASTGLAFVFLNPKNDRYLIEHRGANSQLKPSDIKKKNLKDVELIHASSVTPEMVASIGSKVSELDVTASLDLGAELTKVGKEKLLDMLQSFDICFMNEETFENIFKTKATRKKILKQSPEGLEIFVVTLGSKGAIATDGKKTASSSSYDVKVEDTTGAGDAFAAAFDRFILEGENLERSLDYAAAEAAIKVQHVGAREGLPTIEELEKFVKSH